MVGQSDNYWSWNFNTPSALLAGAVVGGNAGPSAVYYNPALVNHENAPSLSFSANLLSLQFFNAKNIAGQGIDADKFIFKIQPRFISYDLQTKNKKLGLEVAILSPVSQEIQYTLQHIDTIDIIKRTSGDETYSGYMKYMRQFDDTWVGAGLSYKISQNFYVGLSSFLSIKTLNYQYRQLAQAYQEQDSVLVNDYLEASYIAQSSFEEELKYWFLSFIFKTGLQFKTNNENFSAGLNITFPDIPIYGSADIRKSIGRSNIYDNIADAFTNNEVTTQVEETNSKVRVKNPFSIAIGAQYSTPNRKNAILFSAEYFNKIDSYAIVQSNLTTSGWLPDYIAENLPDKDFMSYYFEARSVTNFAIGFKQFISQSLTFLGGLRTDFTNADIENPRYVGNKFSINQIHLDMYHITAGAFLKIKKVKVVAGLQYTYGRNKEMLEIVNYANPVEYIPQTDQALEGVRQQDAEIKLNEIALFFGLSLELK